jgi:hypothetical protein
MPITPTICTNKTSNDNKDTHSQEKNKKGRNRKERPHRGDETLATTTL